MSNIQEGCSGYFVEVGHCQVEWCKVHNQQGRLCEALISLRQSREKLAEVQEYSRFNFDRAEKAEAALAEETAKRERAEEREKYCHEISHTVIPPNCLDCGKKLPPTFLSWMEERSRAESLASRLAEVERERVPLIAAVERLVGEIKRERIGEPSYRGMDHACRECPGATMVQDGFLCPLHFGESVLAQLPVTPAPVEEKKPHCHVCCDGSDPRHITCASAPNPECENHAAPVERVKPSEER